MGVKTLDEYQLHDCRILCITIDRVQPGKADNLIFNVTFPDGNAAELTFKDC